ncbi:hypothetical protein [Runella sp.]|uniref:hypothetical protein n=1 Tax=Runella sp. TaxID=1960881 RepID=UPI00261B980D|nr:hypothetical protein [Runella sp.]
MKKAIFYLLLLVLTGCEWQDPTLKTLKTCQKPTAITATANAANPRQYTFVLSGVTTDIAFPVTWKQGSTTLGTSNNATFGYTFGADGNFVVTAEMTTICGEKITLTANTSIKTCALPTDISVTADALDFQKLTFMLTTNAPADVKTIMWRLRKGNTIIVESQLSINERFVHKVITGGDYVVTAEIATICNEQTTLTKNVTVKVCTSPTKIVALSNADNVFTYSLATDVPSDIKTVTWRVLSGNNPLIQEQLPIGNMFSYTFAASGTYTIVADVETVCNEKLMFSLSSNVQVQDVTKIWDKTFGGSQRDEPYAGMVPTVDGGYLIGGFSGSSASGDKIENGRGNEDYWVVKINTNGTKQWDKTFGGTGTDVMTGIIATSDGGFLLGGYSNSNASNEKSENSYGGFDYWVVKIGANGQKQWDKTLGGGEDDIMSGVVAAMDGGFVLGGSSSSTISGIKSEGKRGISDYWAVKINSSGQKQWDKTFGGINTQSMTTLSTASDGGFLLGGWSTSNASGDKSDDIRGGWDYWIVKIGGNGQKQWDKTLGGVEDDVLETILPTSDNGFLLGGTSPSNISGDKSEQRRGGTDFWIVRINSNGQKLWDKTLGGASIDEMSSITSTADGGFLLSGSSSSDISGEKSENSRGNRDYWIIKTNVNGQKQWDKTLGGSGDDNQVKMTATSDGRFLLGGYSDSNISGEKSENNRGGRDFWVIKVK